MEKTLIVLDFDGTITGPFPVSGTWARIDNSVLDATGVGATQFIRRYFVSITRNEQHHRTWFEMTLQAWREAGLKRSDLQKLFSNNIGHMRPGLAEFLSWLKHGREDSVHVVINSYGIIQVIRMILEAERITHLVDDVFAIPVCFTSDGMLDGYDERLLITTEMKGTVTSLAMQRWGVSQERTIGIGDSKGDALIAPKHRLLIARSEIEVEANKSAFNNQYVISDDWSGVRDWLTHNFLL